MKKIILLLSLLLFASCNNDDDNPIEQTNHQAVATWHLTIYSGGFAQPYFYTNEITWVINPNNTIDVVIEEGTDVSINLPLNSSGNYTYTINENEDRDEIIIDGITYYFLMGNTGAKLFIEDEIGAEADGMSLIFDKVIEQN